MKNKCTLIIDGNWLLQSRMAVMMHEFNINFPQDKRLQSQYELRNRMAYSIVKILNRFSCIDNIILVVDGGSWRKKLPVPEILSNVTYKGNRVTENEIDWNSIYDSLNGLVKNCEELGITTSHFIDIEGDDWCWYWSKKLNSEGIHCVIWTVDNDLKQLIQVDGGAMTAWYNDKNGLYLHESLQEQNFDDIDFFLKPEIRSNVVEELKKNANQVSYINPNNIILSKIICGDNSDNIKSVVRYIKNGKNRRIGEKEWETLANNLNIKDIKTFYSKIFISRSHGRKIE